MASNKKNSNNHFLLLLNLQFFFCAAHDKHLSESVGLLKERLITIYEKYDADYTPNVRALLASEHRNFFNTLDNLTKQQFDLIKAFDRKWTKLNKIFSIKLSEVFELINQLDDKKRENLRKFVENAENVIKLMKMLAKINNPKFERLIQWLYNVLNRAERIEYAKYVEEQSREIRVKSIFMKYAKVKVDDLLSTNKESYKEVEKYDKKFKKFLEFLVTKFLNESKEKLEEFIGDLMQNCEINISYRQKAGSVLFDYRNYYKKLMLKNVSLVFEKKYSIEKLIKELSEIVSEYNESFLKNWMSVEKFGKDFCQYRKFVWKQILNKILKKEEQIKLDTFLDELVKQRQLFELEKYDKNFKKLLELVKQVRENEFMRLFMEIPEVKLLSFRKFSFKIFLDELKTMAKEFNS
ncbi:hypothetical protein GPALN_003398 [Globodera pallida]|nr:hypothetical protein GPALN_003398 [Globodera pallida]